MRTQRRDVMVEELSRTGGRTNLMSETSPPIMRSGGSVSVALAYRALRNARLSAIVSATMAGEGPPGTPRKLTQVSRESAS